MVSRIYRLPLALSATVLATLSATLEVHCVLLSGHFALGFISPVFWLRPLTAVLLAIPGMDTGGL